MGQNAIIVANPGSKSRKYSVHVDGRQMLFAHFEHDGESAVVTFDSMLGREKRVITDKDYSNAFEYSINYVRSAGISINADDIAAVGIRVVAPGTFFMGHKKLDDAYAKKLAAAKSVAPLHVRSVLVEIEQIRSAFPEVLIFGISDSEFHRDMPDRARLYAIPHEDAAGLDLYRFGYHGLSVASVMRKLGEYDEVKTERVIVCHLGGGSSVTALRDGKSIDTSMGFTPDEGVPMSTRVGSMGVGAAFYLAGTFKDDVSSEQYFNEKSGLFGVSGGIDDIRELLKAEEDGDERARTALDLYVYAVRKYIGAYAVALGGVDTIVLTGTIGERSLPIRSRICSDLEWLGVEFDEERSAGVVGIDGNITPATSDVLVLVIRSREMDEMALITSNALGAQDESESR